MEYSVGQKVWEIKINKSRNTPSTWSARQDGVYIKEMSILGISPYKIVLDNDYFTTLEVDREGRKRDLKYYTYLNQETISIITNNTMFDEGIFCTMYSTKKPDKKLLNKLVNNIGKKVYKDYGFLFGGAIEEIKTLIKNYAE